MDRIKNPEGKVYIQYYQPVPKYIKIGSNEYVCEVRRGVSMLLVNEDEVDRFLDVEGGCCGGKRKVFQLPHQNVVNFWETGQY